MTNFFIPRSNKQQRSAKIQWAVLTAALLLALVVLPVSADHEDEVEYTSAYENASRSIDAGSARLAALGQLFYADQSLEASHAASTSRYEALASFYGQGNSVVVAQNAAELAALGQLFYAAQSLEASHAASTSRYEALASFYGQGNSVVVAQNAAELAANPELKSFSGSAAVASDFLATNPETKYASGWGGSSAAVANSGPGSENPELAAFQQYCGC